MPVAQAQIKVTFKPGITLEEMSEAITLIQSMDHVESTRLVTGDEGDDLTRLQRASSWKLTKGDHVEPVGDSPLAGSMMLLLAKLDGVVKGAKTLWELLHANFPETWPSSRMDQVRACYRRILNRVEQREEETGQPSPFRLLSRRGLYGLEREYAPGRVVTDASKAVLRDIPEELLTQLRQEGMWV